MVWGHTEISQRNLMLLCRVSCVPLPAIAGVLLRQIHHQLIAPDLSDDRRRGNRQAQRVSANHGGRPSLQGRRNAVAVDQGMIAAIRQPFHRAFHRQHRGVQNVESVNFFDTCNTKSHVGMVPELLCQGRTTGWSQAF